MHELLIQEHNLIITARGFKTYFPVFCCNCEILCVCHSQLIWLSLQPATPVQYKSQISAGETEVKYLEVAAGAEVEVS